MKTDDNWKEMAREHQAWERLTEACVAALDREGVELHLDERVEIHLAKEIVAAYAARGEHLPLYRPRDRLRQIVEEREELE
jgi:hypothetical protein